jgi:transposase-like protein
MSADRLCHDIENKTGMVPVQPGALGCPPVSLRGEDRRHQAIARYLAGDHIEEICQELGCSKSWLYKWRDRYQANDPTWAQEQTRRPKSNPRQTLDTIAEAIIHLYQAWESQESGRPSVATIWQALKEQGLAPLPSRRTIYRIVQRHSKEANRDTPHRQSHRSSGACAPGAVATS